jgi:hypothetical protein
MTLAQYDPEGLDRLALRFLDLAATIRGMSRLAREHEIETIKIHAGKLAEWLWHLDHWSRDARGQLDKRVASLKAEKLAAELGGLGTGMKVRAKKSR